MLEIAGSCRKAVLIGPRRIAEDAMELVWVRPLDCAHRVLKRTSDVRRDRAHVLPVRAVREAEIDGPRRTSVVSVTVGSVKARRCSSCHVADAV